jgi:hypothetical protein
MSTPRRGITVSRDYKPEADACVRALQVLLNPSVIKMADKPAPEPDGRNDASIRNEKEVSDVDQRSEGPT